MSSASYRSAASSLERLSAGLGLGVSGSAPRKPQNINQMTEDQKERYERYVKLCQKSEFPNFLFGHCFCPHCRVDVLENWGGQDLITGCRNCFRTFCD